MHKKVVQRGSYIKGVYVEFADVSLDFPGLVYHVENQDRYPEQKTQDEEA